MSSVQPTPEAIEKFFLKSTLTPFSQSEPPNYTSIKILQDELISNAVSVYSPLGDGDTGHLFLVVSNEQYLKATNTNAPALPSSPVVPTTVTPVIGSNLNAAGTTGTSTRSTTTDPVADATAAALAATAATTAASVAATAAELSKLTYRDYLRDNNNYLLYHNTSKCLVKQIVKAVPMIYIEELENPITKFGKLTPYALLKHLLDTYGAVSDSDLDANQVRMKAKWMPPMPIEALFRQLRKAQDFAEQAGEEIPDTALCRAGYNNLQSTGLFTQSCYEWRMIQSPTNKTWDKFKAHFTLAAKDRKNSSRNTQDAGYHETANNTVDDNATVDTMGTTQSDISALTEAILTQTAANATNFDNMLSLMQHNSANFVQGGTPSGSNSTSFKSKHYCWTHGRSFNKDHTSAKCEHPAEGHVSTATWRNKLGGTDRDLTTGATSKK